MIARDFWSRWSRRKLHTESSKAERRGPDAPEPPNKAGKEPGSSSAVATAPKTTEGPAAQEEPDLSIEELAKLPRIEELTAQTDLTQFLRKGVPPGLRNAALRRMWSLDPAIRDFVGEARDYSYDWNVPGGVPGSGPLLPHEHAAAVLRQLAGSESTPSSHQMRAGEEDAKSDQSGSCQTPATQDLDSQGDIRASSNEDPAVPAALKEEKPPLPTPAATDDCPDDAVRSAQHPDPRSPLLKPRFEQIF